MEDITSEFINKKILKIQTEPTDKKFINWLVFLNEKFLLHKNLLIEFSEKYKPTQNQIDFVRSISLNNIFKLIKNNKKISKDILTECLSIINKNIEKFPQIKKTSYNFPDNIRFESILNLNLLKFILDSLEKIYSLLNKTRDKKQIVIDVTKLVKTEIKLIKNRIIEIKVNINKIPKILTEEKKHLKKFDLNKKPKISVITLSYNLAPFVEETMRSIANQNCNDFEHIVIDGASSDDSLKLLKKYPNIILVSEKDRGFPDAFWKGLKLAKGKYILQCSISDGYASYDWLSKCTKILDKNSDVSLVWGFPQHLTENSKLGSISYPQFHYNEVPQKQEMFSHWLKTGFFYPEGNLCVRKSVILRCYPTAKECKKGIIDWLEFSYRFNSLGYISMHLPTLANFGRIHSNQLGEQLTKEWKMKLREDNYFKKITYFKIKLLIGLIKHNFIDSEGNKIELKFDKKKLVMENIIIFLLKINKKYLNPKKYLNFIRKKIFKKNV